MPPTVEQRKAAILELVQTFRDYADGLEEGALTKERVAFATDELEAMLGGCTLGVIAAILNTAKRCGCTSRGIGAGFMSLFEEVAPRKRKQ
jgi:hypothetical protein